MRAAVLLLIAACGRVGFDGAPAVDPDGGAHDGARLRIIWNTFEDGTRMPAGVYDSERAEPCEINEWADGALYCTPTARVLALFADASCNDALATTGSCGGDPYVFTEDLCTRRITHLYAKGAQVTPAMYYVRDRYTPSCVAQGGAPPLFATAEVAPAELARVAVTGAVVRTYTSEDGLALPFALRDDVHGVDCQPTAAAPDGYTCLPAADDDPVYGLDAACATRVVGSPLSCPPPDFVAYPGADCRAHVASVTSTIGGIGGWSLPLCTDAENGPGANWYLVGADITGPTEQRTIDRALPGRRLATISFAPGLRDTALFDTVLGIECTPTVSSDGVARCLPVHRATVRTLSTNVTMCLGSPVDVGLVSLGCTDPAPDAIARAMAGPACEPSRVELSAVGAPTTAYGFFGGECAALPAFEIGAPIDPSIYASYTTGMDP